MVRVRSAPALIFIPALLATSVVFGQQPASAEDEITEEATPAPSYVGDYVPQGARDESVLVTVRLEGNPVAVEQGRAGRKLSRAEKDRIKSDLKTQQDALAPQIAGAGASIVGQYQSAINAMKVRTSLAGVSALRALPGVVAVDPVEIVVPGNTVGVPYISAPQAWETTGFRGEGIKIGIIDTGIDYLHANFGGPGTHGAYAAFNKKDAKKAAPGQFGPKAAKVKGGVDLAGDTYDASSTDPAINTPHPDVNPLDCNGHGSHVAGTAAGLGVLDSGATYKGKYDSAAYEANTFRIGPGVAPLADLYSIRVFGCTGSTTLTVDAIDWAVDNDMDVINMSLGSPYGRKEAASAVAADNAAAGGMIVVTSAGNEANLPYIVGAPAAGLRTISVAAIDPNVTLPGFHVVFGNSSVLDALNANQATVADGTAYANVKVLVNDPATARDESLGCSVADFGALAPGTLVVVNRGSCARVAKAIFGQQAGAVAVAMINNAAGYPPLEGPITSNPDDGVPFTVTIPFLGIRGADAALARAAGGSTATLTGLQLVNPGFRTLAGFSSSGPRLGDSFLKPDVSAPGVSTFSTAVGTGAEGEFLSGTSMAAPHVAGVAALTKQSKPGWSAEDIRAAIVNSGDASKVTSYRTGRGGTGLIQPLASTRTQAVAVTADGASTLNFGFDHITGATYTASRTLTIRNHGSAAMTFAPAAAPSTSIPAAVSFGASSVTVPAGGSAPLTVNLSATAGSAGSQSAFNEVAGLVNLTPAAGQNNGVTLHVAYYFVPRVAANVGAAVSPALAKANATNTVTLTNPVANAGTARLFTWGIADADEASVDHFDIRAVGVRGLNDPTLGRVLQFAINFHERNSTASVGEVDLYIDTTGDGVADYIGFAADFGLVTAGAFDGQYVSFVFNVATGTTTALFLANASSDQSTIILTFRAADFGRTATAPRFTYRAVAFNFRGPDDNVLGETGAYNAFTAAISASTGLFGIAPGATVPTTTTTSATEWDLSTPKGLMIVYIDNAAGPSEAQLIPAG
ncbi:MAG TPA: S8 family serine peptidase [Candidatus Limnocylindria bacterium]|jgi:subtilisin family serine protease|nr:S8 family serine peptidase [Candidatus Limnocylindria bacterium]